MQYIAGVDGGGQSKTSDKSRNDEIETEKKRIRQVNIIASHATYTPC